MAGWLAVRRPTQLLDAAGTQGGNGIAVAQLLGVMPERILAAGERDRGSSVVRSRVLKHAYARTMHKRAFLAC
jgi:hypothetical protein